MKFFVAGADDIKFYLIRRDGLNLMFTAGHHFKGKTHKFHLDKPITHEKLFIDSGGFQFFSRFKEYPFSISDYVLWVHEVNPDMFATMDYPCEPELLKKNHTTVKENINRTVENARLTFEYMINPDIQVVPVIQGWLPEDYLYCVDKYKSQGLITDYMAVGTLCRRGDVNSILKILRVIKHELPNIKLHGFGVKISILYNSETYSLLESCDSASWVSEVRAGDIVLFTGKRLLRIPYHGLHIDAWERLSISLNGYVSFIEYLIAKHGEANQSYTEQEMKKQTLVPYIQKEVS